MTGKTDTPAEIAADDVVTWLRLHAHSVAYPLPIKESGEARNLAVAADLIERQAAEIARLQAERDGIRADQQPAVADILNLGSVSWRAAMLHAANIASQMRASRLLVRTLEDRATLPTPTADKEG